MAYDFVLAQPSSTFKYFRLPKFNSQVLGQTAVWFFKGFLFFPFFYLLTLSELSLESDTRDWRKKLYSHSMQELPDAYSAVPYSFHGVWKLKSLK